MSLAPGTRIGSYQILAPVGAGGMGEALVMELVPGEDRAQRLARGPV